MPRWQYDEDSDRLPHGFKRVGYDADTQRYVFQEGQTLYHGPAGAEFGEMTAIGTAPVPEEDDLEGYERSVHTRRDGYQRVGTDAYEDPNRRAQRYMAPFYLLIGVVTLGLIYMLWGSRPAPHVCASGYESYTVKPGDTCYDIAQVRGMSVPQLEEANPGVNCAALQIHSKLCVLPSDGK